MGVSSGLATFKLTFQLSPIVMTGGLASGIPGGALPFMAISQAVSFTGGLLNPGDTALSIEDYFANFQPLAGSTLIDQQIGMYPFANQTVAANAGIQQPLTISMLMTCPAGAGGGYASKQSLMQAIQSSFYNHNTSGGLYTILTPSFPYVDCVMMNMTDVSGGQTRQVQWQYKLDFLKPLVTLAAAGQAQNALMNQISNGLPTSGAQSGAANLVGSTSGGQAPVFFPSASQAATGIAGGGTGTGIYPFLPSQ